MCVRNEKYIEYIDFDEEQWFVSNKIFSVDEMYLVNSVDEFN